MKKILQSVKSRDDVKDLEEEEIPGIQSKVKQVKLEKN